MKTHGWQLLWTRYRFMLLILLGLGLLFAWMNSSLMAANVKISAQYNPPITAIETQKDYAETRAIIKRDHLTTREYVAKRDSVFDASAQGKFEVAVGQKGVSLGQDVALLAVLSLMAGAVLVVFGKYHHFFEWLRGSGINAQRLALSELGLWLGTFNAVGLIVQGILYISLTQLLPAANIHLGWQNIVAFVLLNQLLASLWFILGLLMGAVFARPLPGLIYSFIFGLLLNYFRLGPISSNRALTIHSLYSPGSSTGVLILGLIVLIMALAWLFVHWQSRVSYADYPLTAFPKFDWLFVVGMIFLMIFGLSAGFNYWAWQSIVVFVVFAAVVVWQAYWTRFQTQLVKRTN